MRRLKVKYIVNLWIKDTSIQGTKCCVPLCPLKRGSTVYTRCGTYLTSRILVQHLSESGVYSIGVELAVALIQL